MNPAESESSAVSSDMFLQQGTEYQVYYFKIDTTQESLSENNPYVVVSTGLSSDLFCEVGNDKRSLYIKSKSAIRLYCNKCGQDRPG